MKNKFLVFLTVIIVLIPTFVSVGYYIALNGAQVNENSISKITLTDLDGKEYVFEKTSADLDMGDISGNMIQFFADTNANSTSEAQLPDQLVGARYYKLIFNSYGRDVEYDYYFTENPDLCYYVDNNAQCYHIPSSHSSAFLTSIYGKSVFASATLPIMTTQSGEVINPVSIKWTYLAINDIYPTYTATDESAVSSAVYNMSYDFHLSFSIPVGTVSVVIKSGDVEVYNGIYDDVNTVELPKNTELDVSVDAKWFAAAERASEGELTYVFKCTIN